MKIKKTILSILILFLCFPAFAVMYLNDVVCAFNGSDEFKSSLESKMVDAASLFFQSYKEAINLINEVEITSKGNTEFDFNKATAYTNEAIKSLENSLSIYKEVLDTGKALGYNEFKRSMFTSFDYNSFIMMNNLNSVVAKRVQAYLSTFDIIGAHNQNIDNLSSCLTTLYSIKAKLAANKILENGLYFELINKYADTMLFGNYLTRIGSQILQGCPR